MCVVDGVDVSIVWVRWFGVMMVSSVCRVESVCSLCVFFFKQKTAYEI